MRIKRFVILTITLFLYTLSNAQTWDWAIKMGGVAGDQSKRIATDNFGNVYLLGSFQTDTLVLGLDTLINRGGTGKLVVEQ